MSEHRLVCECGDAAAFDRQPLGQRRVVGVVDAGQQRPDTQRRRIAMPALGHRRLQHLQIGRDLPAQRMLAGLDRLGAVHAARAKDHFAQVAPCLGAGVLGPEQRSEAIARDPLAAAQCEAGQQLVAALGQERHGELGVLEHRRTQQAHARQGGRIHGPVASDTLLDKGMGSRK